MPGGDGTGPFGTGGFCTPLLQSGQISIPLRRGFFGRGRGMGLGRGFAWRRIAFAPAVPLTSVDRIVPVYPAQPVQLTKEQEKQYLENEARAIEEEQEALEQELEAVKKKLDEVKKQK